MAIDIIMGGIWLFIGYCSCTDDEEFGNGFYWFMSVFFFALHVTFILKNFI